jgi:F1F0 ATPase subunit 2
MSETVSWLLSGFAGLLLGVGFFGGLWWTVQKGLTAKQPALWFLGSLILRTSIVLIGFYIVGGGQWHRLLGCLVGFMLARVIVTRLTVPPLAMPAVTAIPTEANRAT